MSDDRRHRRGHTAAWIAAALLIAALLAAWPAFDNGRSPRLRADEAAPLSTAQRDQARRLLVQYQCGSCHAIEGVSGGQGAMGPTLAQFGRRSYIAGELPNNAATLARWLVDPAALLPGTTMPAMGVTEADAQQMAAYLMQER